MNAALAKIEQSLADSESQVTDGRSRIAAPADPESTVVTILVLVLIAVLIAVSAVVECAAQRNPGITGAHATTPKSGPH